MPIVPTAPRTQVLDYHRLRDPVPTWHWLLLGSGAVPFLMVFGAIAIEGVTGDPPDNLAEFKAYHYWTGIAVGLAVVWTGGMFVAFRRRYPWVLLVTVVWCLSVGWIGARFLLDLHMHSAGQWYWSQW